MYISDTSTEQHIIYQLHWKPPVNDGTLKELDNELLMIIIHDINNPISDIEKEIYKWTRVYCGRFKEENVSFTIPEEYVHGMADRLLPIIHKCIQATSK